MFVFICLPLCGRLLTGSGDVSRNASQGPCVGAGHTLISAHSQVGQGGDVQAVGAQNHTQIPVQQLHAVQAPADVGGGRPGAAAEIHAAAQLLHHGHGLLSEEWHLI